MDRGLGERDDRGSYGRPSRGGLVFAALSLARVLLQVYRPEILHQVEQSAQMQPQLIQFPSFVFDEFVNPLFLVSRVLRREREGQI